MAEKPKYRVGIIGGGRQGTHHARAYHLHPETEVAAVADTDQENLDLFCERFDVTGYSTFEEMLTKENLDISAPILPVQVNPDAVIASAKAGVKGIFCEKPLAASLSDADRMVEECASRGIPFAAGLVTSSHNDYLKAYEMAASGEIGEILRINLYDGNDQLGTHGMNIARKFAGKADVEFVMGFVENDPFGDHQEDYGNGEPWFGSIGGYVRFANGVECFSGYKSTKDDPASQGPRWRGIEVTGSRGVIYNHNNTGVGLHIRKGPEGVVSTLDEMTEERGIFQDRPTGEEEIDSEGWRIPSEMMMQTISALAKSIDDGSELKATTGDDLRHSLEIVIGLRESARKNGAAVHFPIEDRGLAMYPVASRWHYKKDLFGADWYREAMKTHIKAE